MAIYNNFTESRLDNTFDIWMNNTNSVVEALNSFIETVAGEYGTNTSFPNIATQNVKIYGTLNVSQETAFTGVFTMNVGRVVERLYFTNSNGNLDNNPYIYSADSTAISMVSGIEDINNNYSKLTVRKGTNNDEDYVSIFADILNIGTPQINLSDTSDTIFETTKKINFDVDAAQNLIVEKMEGDHPDQIVQNQLSVTMPDSGILRFGNVAIRSTGEAIHFNPDITDPTLTWDDIAGGDGGAAIDYKNIENNGTGAFLDEDTGIDLAYLCHEDTELGTPVTLKYNDQTSRLEYIGAIADPATPITKMGILTEKRPIGESAFNITVTFLGVVTLTADSSVFEDGAGSIQAGDDFFVSTTNQGKVTETEGTSVSDFAFRILSVNGNDIIALTMPYRPASSGSGNRLITETFTDADGGKIKFQLTYPVMSLSTDYVMAFVAGVLDSGIQIVREDNNFFVQFDSPPPADQEIVIRYFKDVPVSIIDSKLDRSQYLIDDGADVLVGAQFDKGKYEIWLSNDPLVSADVYFNSTACNIITVSDDISDIKDALNTLNIYVEGNNLRVQNNLGVPKNITVYQKL